MLKKGAIFDKDGILFDTQKDFCEGWKLAGQYFGKVVDQSFLIEMAGSNKWQAAKIIETYYPDVDPWKMRDIMLKYVEYQQQHFLTTKPGVPEILKYLKKQKMPIALASGGTSDMIANNLKQGKIDFYFDAVVAGTDVKKAKPEPDIFILAAKKLNLDPKDCYVFEDSPKGLQAGREAGCFTVMIPDCFEDTPELKDIHDTVCKDFFEVRDRMEKGLL